MTKEVKIKKGNWRAGTRENAHARAGWGLTSSLNGQLNKLFTKKLAKMFFFSIKMVDK